MPPLARPISSADLRSHNGQLPAAPAPDGQGHAGRGLSLKIGIERKAYVAGQQIKGVLELSVRDKRIALGEVGVEFTAHEQLRSRDHTSTRRLLSTRLDFQGNGLPPSNAVVPGSRPIQSAFYPALPGRTRFAFVFNVPANMPSSCSLGSNATTRYELRAFASSLLEGNIDIRSEKMEVQVVERWADWREGPWQKGAERKAAEKLAMGGDGQLELTAQLGMSNWAEKPARLFWRGDHDMEVSGKTKIEVNAKVRNLSKRHVTGFKLSLHRRLRTLYPEGSRPLVEPPIVSTMIATERFHGIDYDVRSQGERDVVLPMSVPPDECWTVRKGALFGLDVVLRVEVECGFLQKPLAVDIPVWVAHPLSLPNSAHRFAADERTRIAPAPAPAPTQPSIPYSSLTVGVSSPASYNAFSPEPFAPAFADQLPLPGTPAPRQAHYAESTISMSSAVSSPAIYPHSTPAPSFPPPPVALAELWDPVPSFLQHNVPHGYVAFDPRVPDLSVSGFVGGMQHPQAFSAPPPPPSLVGNAPSVSHAPPPSVSPVPHHHAVRPPSRAYTLPADLNLTPHELEQVHANIAPLEPYVIAERAHHDPRTGSNVPYLQHHAIRQNSVPPFEHEPASATPPTPPRPCPSPLPSHRQLEDLTSMPPPPPRSRTPLRTPPPPASSSHFRQSPSPSPSPVESTFASALAPTASGLLESIGEDGESQAGTARSAMLPAGMANALKVSQNGDEDVRSVKATNSPGRNSVQDLEDFVEQEERRAEEARTANSAKGVEGAVPVEEKRLPPSPARSEAEAVRPKAQDIFTSPPPDTVPTSPPLIPFPSSPSPSNPPKRDAGGLSALEARLARPVTPDLTALSLSSRSPSPIKSSRVQSPSLHAPTAVPTSALRARSISRASRYREIQAQVEQVEANPTEAVRQAAQKAPWARQSTVPPAASRPQPEASATSTTTKERPRPLTLAEPPQSSQTAVSPPSPRRALPTPPSQAITAVAALPPPPSSASSPPSTPVSPTKSSKRPVFTTRKAVPETNTNESSFAAKKPSSASPWSSKAASPSPWSSARLQPQAAPTPVRSSPPISQDAPISPVSPVDVSGRKVVDVAEVKELKRDAVDRVAGWLRESSSPDAEAALPPLQLERTAFQPSSRNKRFTIDFGRPAPSPPSSVGAEETRQEPTVAQLLAAESRAALRQIQQSAPTGLKPSSAVKKGLDGYLASLEHDAQVSKDELAHRSAKATKPGKVKSVASIWAERVEEADREKTTSPPPKQHKPSKSMSSIQLSDAPTPALRPLAPNNSTTPTRVRPVSLQPSSVQDRSPPAAPFLNTTIGRPAPSSAPRFIRTPGVTMTTSESAPTGLAASTGRNNKVANLLARYQQQIA
ncbi:hypothetical protein JCM10296v2_006679 [Rhodotorula toruloides]